MPNLAAAGVALSVLAGCAQMRAHELEYPVQPPPLTEREQQNLDDLVEAFTSIDASRQVVPAKSELEVLDEAQQRRLREARRPAGGLAPNAEPRASRLDMLQDEMDDRRRQRLQDRERTSGYSRGEINALKRRVSRRYDSSHDIRHELRAKYGL